MTLGPVSLIAEHYLLFFGKELRTLIKLCFHFPKLPQKKGSQRKPKDPKLIKTTRLVLSSFGILSRAKGGKNAKNPKYPA